jgi:signal transduction histidine kinase
MTRTESLLVAHGAYNSAFSSPVQDPGSMEYMRMGDLLHGVFHTDGYHPHGFCYLWQPGLVWLHVVSDALIGLSYVAIGFGLAYFVRRGRGEQLPFSMMFVAFGVFIAACGATHFMNIWTLWSPVYWFSGSVKAVTAAASVFTAMALPPLIPVALATLAAARLSDRHRTDLEQAHTRLKEMDELKTQFFANVSHELRTPLALILGPVEQLLRQGSLADADRRRLQTVQRNGELLLRHVNDLLEVARLEAGGVQLEYRRTDLARLVRRASAHFESVAMTRAISFSVEAPGELAAEIDPAQIDRVLFNLLGNASKFTPPEGEIRCVMEVVERSQHTREPAVRITVHDSGPGVPRDQRERIFEPFRQADGGSARRHGGTGLGLAIVSDLVELHGGSVWVEDSPLGGAAFVVELPLVAPSGVGVAEDDVEADSRRPPFHEFIEPEAATDGTDEPEGEPDRPLVLVVDDNREMNHFITETLGDRYRTARAYNGREGIERALELRPDLIVSDLMMPEVTGETLVRELRSNPNLDATPILLLSARADDEVRLGLLREGAQDYLTKPFSTEELRARVGNWMAMKRARDVLRSALDITYGDVETLAGQISERNRELHAAMDALRVAFEEADAANRAKADFLSVMSHELRTPLNGILGYVDLLEAGIHGSLNTGQQAYLARVKATAQHLHGLVEGVLTFARIEAGAEQIAQDVVDLREVVQEAESIIRPIAAGQGLDLEVHVPDEPVLIGTDRRKALQIVVNLAANAVKFTETGRVRLTLGTQADWTVIRVEDTGSGISSEHLEKIFDPFWQVDSSKTRSAGGTGLGLSVTRRLARLLGGDVAVESQPGTGSTFTARLPMRAPSPSADH